MSDDASVPRNMLWHKTADERAWVDSAVAELRGAMSAALEQASHSLLLVSGGSSPAPVLRALSNIDIDWSRMIVSLVDERDVDPADVGSNAHFVQKTLLSNRAAKATFWPLREAGQALDDAVRTANRRWRAGPAPAIAAVVLGMGEDAHTASLFPGAGGLAFALASGDPYAEIDASDCPGAGAWPRRISLTPAGVSRASLRLLLLRGAGKRVVFERALATDDVREAPVRIAVDAPGAQLHVHWCAV
jgi:6-phosphogluconolactonase